MKKIALATFLLSSGSLVAQDYWCLNNHLAISGDYLYWRRQDVRDLPLVKDSQTERTVMNTEDLEKRLCWESGVSGRLTYFADACSSVELLYTYMLPWKGKDLVTGDGTLFFPFNQPVTVTDYVNADMVVGNYKTELRNGEFNYWGHVTPQRVNYFSFSWNIGFRTFYLPETFTLDFFRGVDRSTYKIHTTNNLYGLQLGAMLEMNPSRCWTWTFIIKGAIFGNDAKNRLRILDNNNTTTFRSYSKSKWTDSYLLEGYGRLAYHMTSKFSAHIAYQGFILTGVALAPNQRDKSHVSRDRLNVKGQIVVDGLLAGLDIGF